MFDESQTKLPTTLLSVVAPVLQTREPTWKEFGPTLTLLLSRPMMSHVTVLMVNCARAVCAPARQRKSATRQRRTGFAAPARARTRKNVRALSRFFSSKVIVAASVPLAARTRAARKPSPETPALLLFLLVVPLLAGEP